MKKKIYKIFFVIFCVFAFVGGITLSTIIHEYSHFNDFRELQGNITNSELCGLVLPTTFEQVKDLDSALGYYRFSYTWDNSTKKRVEEIGGITEIKAYTLTTIVLSLMILSMMVVLWKFLFNYEPDRIIIKHYIYPK